MKTLNETQQKLLEVAAEASRRADLMARECDKAELMTLAREWDYFSKSFAKAIERQLRVFEQPAVEPAPAPEKQKLAL